MLIKSVKMQMSVLMKRKSTIVMYFFILLLVLANFYTNIVRYYGKDLIDMYHPMKLLLLSDYNALGFYFMQYFPILVVIPAAFSFINDYNSKELLFIESRVGSRNYYLGKFISVFLITFLIFTIPLLIEIMLNCLAFPIAATGDPSNFDLYSSTYIEYARDYLLPSFFVKSPYLYTIFFTVVFGVVSGVLSTFALAISTFSFMKFRILVFLPVYILLYVLNIMRTVFTSIEYTTNYFFYLRTFNASHKNGFRYLGLTILVFGIAFLIIALRSRKDNLV